MKFSSIFHPWTFINYNAVSEKIWRLNYLLEHTICPNSTMCWHFYVHLKFWNRRTLQNKNNNNNNDNNNNNKLAVYKYTFQVSASNRKADTAERHRDYCQANVLQRLQSPTRWRSYREVETSNTADRHINFFCLKIVFRRLLDSNANTNVNKSIGESFLKILVDL